MSSAPAKRHFRSDDPAVPDRGLMIREPWVSQILMSRKSWELRGVTTKVRGRLALIRSKSGLVVGEAELVDCIGPLSLETLLSTGALSQMEKDEIEQQGRPPYVQTDDVTSKTFAWVMSNPILYSRPIPYKHPSGAITFVDLTKPGVLRSTEASSSTTETGTGQLQLL